MTRGVRWSLVGSLVLVALAGCGRWIAEREPWRREAEVECLKSGAVKESPSVAMLSAIDGPGICGADYPLKVASLGESSVLGYADEPLRPPGAIPQAGSSYPRPPIARSQPSVTTMPQPPLSQYPPNGPPASQYPAVRTVPAQPDAPLSLAPPGIDPPTRDPPGSYATTLPNYGAPRHSYPERDTNPARGYPSPANAAEAPHRPEQRDRSAPFTPRDRSAGETVPLAPSRSRQPVLTTASVTPAATLACPIVSALDRWIAAAVQPAAQRWFGQPVVEIKQISAYSCRGMNGQPGARISEHAFGNALDIAAFTLADGHKITVKDGWRGSPEEQGFLHDVQMAACEQFTTVLAPGSNAYHYDHIHVDLMRRASGRRICQPEAVSGEVVASRARARYAGNRRSEPSITGSIAPRRNGRPARRLLPDSMYEEKLELPRAIAGED